MIRKGKNDYLYKDTGIPWLGYIPQTWSVRRIKSLLWESDLRSKEKHGLLLSLTRRRGIIPQDEATNRIASVEDLSNYKVCKSGDLVMNRMQAWSGMFATAEISGLISPDYSIYKPRCQVNVKYLEYLFKSPIFVEQFARYSKGIGSGFNRLYSPEFGSLPCIYPPLEEQNAIVRYLDYIDNLITRYIRAKQKEFKLLEEQKQAVIQQAVTRGLDPSKNLKPSGIEWLGEIPEHWRVHRLRNVVQMYVSSIDKHAFEDEYSVRLCNYTDVYKNERISENLDFMIATASEEEINQYRLQIGDVLITKDSEMWNDIGVPALVEYVADDLVSGYHLAILRPNKELLNSTYLLRLIQNQLIAAQLHVKANGVTRYGLSHNAIKNVLLPIPPLNEQKAIVDDIEIRTSNITNTIFTYQQQIKQIQEFRTCLIAEIVTGQLNIIQSSKLLPAQLDVFEDEMINEIDNLIEITSNEEE